MQRPELFFLKVEHLDGIGLLLSLLFEVFTVLCSDLGKFLVFCLIIVNASRQVVLFTLQVVYARRLNFIDHDR